MQHNFRIFLVSLSLFCLFSPAIGQKAKTQTSPALTFAASQAKTLGLTEADVQNAVISDDYTSMGVHHTYLQQQYKGTKLFNGILNVVEVNDRMLVSGHRFVPQIAEKAGNPSVLISAENAVSNAASHLGLKVLLPLQKQSEQLPQSLEDLYQKTVFGNAGISREEIPAELVWTLTANNEVVLCWNVRIYATETADWWEVRVSTQNGEVIEKNNWIVTCKVAHVHDEKCALLETNIDEPNPTQNMATLATNDFNVFDLPLEAPSFGGRTVVNSPWNKAGVGNNATTLQWLNDGTTTYTITRGNNVWSKEDIANDDESTIGTSASSPSSDFNFSFTNGGTSAANRNAAITNLFYWNNIVHDVTYQHGFDEVSGNFQTSNMGRGGSGNDYVFADAQDGGGTNNANFGTPPDGSNPRMQMYLWSNNLDGDFDNGVIAHEYGHGISNRLTGGPSNTSCLGNAEQMGEGWSDFMALMLVTNWATANKNDSRGIGTYVLNQPTNGLGIRQYPYSYNMAVSLYDYNYARTHTAVHALGSAWCAMLWDMTWNIIDITPASTDVYGSSGGNNVALRLVLEGMKLQPCSPGFVDGRDAILLADQILYNGQYRCAIWAAFARRGLGYSASQGSSSSMTDGSQATDMPTNPSLTGSTSVSSAAPYQTVTYTMKVQTECTATPNLDVECTLPSGLTYISGGTYTAATNKVSFTNLNIPLGTSANYTFQALVNNTNAFPYYFFSDDIENGTANWTAANAGGNAGGNFQTSTLYPHSGTTGWNANELAVPSAATLISASIVLPASGNVRLSFWHKMLSEPTYDGGIVEISTNGGSTWQSLSALFLQNGYNSTLANTDNTAFANGTSLFSGTINMQQSLVNLNSFVGQTVKFRFRFGSDTGTGGLGWFIDDVQVINATASLTVNSTLKAGATTYDTDAVTVGLDAVPFACTGAPISGTIQGVGMVCPGAGTTLTTLNTAVGPNITYQWKTGTTAGGPYNTNLGTATTQATGNLNSDNYYIVQATCTQAGGSMAATPEKAVIMPPTPSIAFSNPASGNSTLILCSSTAVTMTCTTPNVYEYLWYKNGVAVNYALTPNFTVANNVSGTNTYTVAVSYINGASCLSAVSAPLTITTAIFSATVTPAGPTTFCANSPTTLNGNTAAGYNYQWKRGTTPVGTNSSSYVPNTSGNHNVTITEVNGCMKTSAWVNIIVNPLPTANAGVDKSICTNVSTTIGSAPAAGYSYNWQPPTHLSSASISNPSVSAPNAATTAYTLTVTNTTTTCSNTDMVNVTGLILPATPTLNSTTTPVCQGTTIALSPSNVAAATSVQWYKNNVVLYNQAPTFVTTLSAATASPDAYKIKSKNAAGCFSGFSNIVNTQINAAPTPTITSTPTAVGSTITVCVLGGTSGTAALTANIPVGSPAVTYSWQQSVSGVYTNVAAGANYTASVTNNATNKTFRVEATYSNACAKTSAARTVKLVTSGCTPRMGTVKGGNLTEIIIESDLLTAYPNPTEGLLNVSIENCQATEAKLFLYNTLGQIVAEKEMLIVNGKGVETLDLREMAMGVYSLSFQTKDTQKVQKVVKE